MSGESAPYGEVPGEEEEEREEDGEEALESLGLPYSWESPASWAALELQDGAVIEALLEPLPGGEARPLAVFGISARLSERLYSARYLGTNDKSPPNRRRELGRLFNVRGGRVHLCLTGRRLCEVRAEEGAVHVEELVLYPSLGYEGRLCATHGLRALKEFNSAFLAGSNGKDGGERVEPAVESTDRRRRLLEEAEKGAAVPEVGLGARRLDFFGGLEDLKSRAGVGSTPAVPGSLARARSREEVPRDSKSP